MTFGGFQPISLSDFPGHVAAVLFAQGCNFRCPFCHNGRLLPQNADDCFDGDTVFALLRRHRKMLDGVVFSGGEPTLQPDILELTRRVRNELALRIKLDTNGSRPDVLERLLAAGLLDYVAMDIKAPWAEYPRLAGVPCRIADIQRSVNLIARGGVRHEFRTTVPPALLSPADVERIRDGLPAESAHKTQVFVAEHALAPGMAG